MHVLIRRMHCSPKCVMFFWHSHNAVLCHRVYYCSIPVPIQGGYWLEVWQGSALTVRILCWDFVVIILRCRVGFADTFAEAKGKFPNQRCSRLTLTLTSRRIQPRGFKICLRNSFGIQGRPKEKGFLYITKSLTEQSVSKKVLMGVPLKRYVFFLPCTYLSELRLRPQG